VCPYPHYCNKSDATRLNEIVNKPCAIRFVFAAEVEKVERALEKMKERSSGIAPNSFRNALHHGLNPLRSNLHADAQQNERHDAQDPLNRRRLDLLRDFQSIRVGKPNCEA